MYPFIFFCVINSDIINIQIFVVFEITKIHIFLLISELIQSYNASLIWKNKFKEGCKDYQNKLKINH